MAPASPHRELQWRVNVVFWAVLLLFLVAATFAVPGGGGGEELAVQLAQRA